MSQTSFPFPVAEDDTIWTVPQLAKLIHSSPHTIYALIDSGLLKAFSLSTDASSKRKNWRIRFGSYKEYVRNSESRTGGRIRGK